MTTRTDVLRVRVEADDDGKLHASLVNASKDMDAVNKSAAGVTPGVQKAQGALKDLGEATEESTNAFLGNSRAVTSFGDLLDDLASGQLGRAKREIAALANETGLLAKLFTSGAGTIAITAGIGAAALAVGGLVVAYAKGEAELDDFTRRLVATGQQGVETAADLEKIVDAVGDSTGSYKKAVDALDLLVSSGRYTGQEFGTLSQAIVSFSQLTGGDMSEGLRALDSLTGKLGDGLVNLDSQYHFLTQTVYDQIAALEAQGETDKARELEQKAFADAMNQRADDVRTHLEPLAAAWDDVGTAASKAWHAMTQGAVDTVNSEIKSAESWLADAKDVFSRFANPMATYFNGGLSPQETAANQSPATTTNAQTDAARKQLQAHEAALQSFLEEDKAGVAGFVAQATAINKKRLLALAGVVDQKTIDQVNAAADQQIRDAASRANAQYRGGSEGGVIHAPKEHTDRARQQALDDLRQEIEAQGKLDDLQAQSAAQVQAFKDNLDAQLQIQSQKYALEVASVGMGSKEYQQAQQLLQIQQQSEQAQAQLLKQYQNQQREAENAYAGKDDPQSKEALAARLDNLRQLYQQESAATAQYYAADTAAAKQHYADLDAAQADWKNGLLSGMQDLIDQGHDMADMTKQTFTDVFGQMNDDLVNLDTAGKASFNDLTKSVLADLARMELRVIESQILQSLLGAFATGPSGANMGYFGMYSQSATDQTAGNIVGSIYGSAQGNVFASPSLSQYSNGVVSKPTLFAFAQGAGIMGEGTKPEAIIPLTRMPGGDLGVQAQGAGSGGGVQVIVENHSDSQAQVQQSQDSNGNDIIRVIVGQAVNEVNKQIGRGGSTYKVMQQTFGLSRRGIPVSGG